MPNIIDLLFETEALKVSNAATPFWYTSGKLGMYFINAEYLYGSKEKSEDLLAEIDSRLPYPSEIPQSIGFATRQNFYKNLIYQMTIRAMITEIKINKLDLSKIDYVSGGERRDWVFSFMVADALKKPHLTLLKNGEVWESQAIDAKPKKLNIEAKPLINKKVLHVADLINTASSYFEMWIPAIEALGGKITDTVVAVDRNEPVKEGSARTGRDLLWRRGVRVHALAAATPELFDQAREKGYINDAQFELASRYVKNPDGVMNEFIAQNPNYITQSLASDNKKTAERAQKCLKLNHYSALDNISVKK